MKAILNGIKNQIAFFTIIPVKANDAIENIAKYAYLSPLIGMMIGFLSGLWAVLLSYVFPASIVGIFTLAFILYITGLHHTDGLLDFGDALMIHGSKEKKLAVMHDKYIGVGAIVLVFIVLSITAFSISSISEFANNSKKDLLFAIISAEVSAKFAMMTLASVGNPVKKGMGKPFIDAMHHKYSFIYLLIISIIIGIIGSFMSDVSFVFGILIAIPVALYLKSSAEKNFGGINGDVLGATNDITRMLSLLFILGVLQFRISDFGFRI
ncbi:MAG: adenosylcobinamide-GDP ribazoletransferase [Methanosarcinales archaeon]